MKTTAVPSLLATALLVLVTSLLPLHAEWTSESGVPIGSTDGVVSFTIGETAYIAGGLGMRSYDTTYTDIWRYDPGADAWSLWRDDYPDFRSAWATAFTLGSRLFIGTGAGFSDGNLVFTRNFFVTDLNEEVSSVGEASYRIERLELR